MKVTIVEALSMLALIAGAIFGLWGTLHLTSWDLTPRPGLAAALIPSSGELLRILCAILLAMICGTLLRFSVLITGIALVRGRKAIHWAAPRECANFAFWVSHSWRFFGRGVQHGERCLGFEVALRGQL